MSGDVAGKLDGVSQATDQPRTRSSHLHCPLSLRRGNRDALGMPRGNYSDPPARTDAQAGYPQYSQAHRVLPRKGIQPGSVGTPFPPRVTVSAVPAVRPCTGASGTGKSSEAATGYASG